MADWVDDVAGCVERILARVHRPLRLATPLGLGKPNVLLNAIYRRVANDPEFELEIYTALSLARPKAGNELERRFLEPFLQRHFGPDYPDLEWVEAQHAGTLPANIRLHEFYLQSGAMLNVPSAQRDYVSLNYTHVPRDLATLGIDVIVQLIAVRRDAGTTRFSLACNPDVTLDLLDRIGASGATRPFVVGVIHPDLPFIANEAEVDEDLFDLILDTADSRHKLFALPRVPVGAAEYALGLHASTLIRDGGTLQIGIGALSDALVRALLLRQQHNQAYRAALNTLDGDPSRLADRVGGHDVFSRGLYGASEMIMDGFMHLAGAGILRRRVYDDLALERALARDVISETLPADAADRLYRCGVLPAVVDEHELARLLRFGMLPDGASLQGDRVHWDDGTALATNLDDERTRARWNRLLAGRRLRDGRYLRGAFFLGSSVFYAWLRTLGGDAFDGLSMTRVSDINQLYGGRESLDMLQRRQARFFNTCMMATALGGAVSDTLENGQVVSGVGGQYNFVSMAHQLEDGRSILMLRSCREHAGRCRSNILWDSGMMTIPRHLRDVFVTEYGIADMRGKSDEECIIAMLAISDRRFQQGLMDRAKANGKLRRDFQAPDRWLRNTPEFLEKILSPLYKDMYLKEFPFGSDFDAEELRLLSALRKLQKANASKPRLAAFLLISLMYRIPDDFTPALRRMGLDRPRGLRERVWRRLLARALAA